MVDVESGQDSVNVSTKVSAHPNSQLCIDVKALLRASLAISVLTSSKRYS